MTFAVETHDDTLVITPAIILQAARCDDEACEQTHYAVRFSWIIWTLTIYP